MLTALLAALGHVRESGANYEQRKKMGAPRVHAVPAAVT
jgi:hypothetical protein